MDLSILNLKNIPTAEIGFYNHPNFIAEEQKNPRFLELYAYHVKDRLIDDDYRNKATSIVNAICPIIINEFSKNPRLGACIDLAQATSKILEELGVWNFCHKGSLTIEYDASLDISTKYFWTIDKGNFTAAHAWIVAPPFAVIDLSIGFQHYTGKEQDYLPNGLVCQEMQETSIEPIDIINPSIFPTQDLASAMDRVLSDHPAMHQIMQDFPALCAKHEQVRIKYIPTAISMSDGSLQEITSIDFNGITALDLYEKKILPIVDKMDAH